MGYMAGDNNPLDSGSKKWKYILKNKIRSKVIFLNLDERYTFENGGRDYLLSINGLSDNKIMKNIES